MTGRIARRLRGVVILLALVLAAGPAGASVRRLTHDARSDDLPHVNGAGQAVWVSGSAGDTALDFWDGAAVRQLATQVDTTADPQIAENGQVVWQGYDSGYQLLFVWDGSQTRQLFRNRYAGFHWRANAAGQVVWQATDGKALQVYLWDGGSVRQLSRASGDNINPQINRAGQVVWENSGHVYLWDGAKVRELTVPGRQAFYTRYPQINDRPGGAPGWVVWVGQDELTRIHGFSLWDGATVRRISDTPDGILENLSISDAGTVAFQFRTSPTPHTELYVWDGVTHRLAEDHSRYQMNRAGQIAWEQQGSAPSGYPGRGEIFLWDGATTRSLGKTGIDYPEFRINDAGQVAWIGRRNVGTAVYRWDGRSVEVISRTPEEEDPGVREQRKLQLGDGGHAVWVGDVWYESAEIFLYTPPASGSLELELPIVTGGESTIGRVTLPEAAPPGGAVVQVTSGNPAVAMVPSSVTIPAGERAATFPVTSFPVLPSTTVTLSAAYGGQTWTAVLEVRQVGIGLLGGVTQLTTAHSRNAWPRLNDAGQVAWLSTTPAFASQILLWTDGPIPAIRSIETDHIGPPSSINTRGELLWEWPGGNVTERTLYHWDGRSAVPFAPIGVGAGNEQLSDLPGNAPGQIAWESWQQQGPTLQYHSTLWLWDGAVRRPLAQDAGPTSLNNTGDLIWETWDGAAATIYLWDGVTVRALNRYSWFDSSLQLNDRRQVLRLQNGGALFLGDGESEHRLADHALRATMNNRGWVLWETDGKIYLWNGATTRQINSELGFPGGSARLNDAGEVAWIGAMGRFAQLFLWHDGTIQPITQDELNKQEPQLNNAGQVVWTGGDYQAPQVYLYTPPLDLAVRPAPLIGKHPATGVITLAAPAPAGGAVVQLASQSAAVTVPASVTVPAGLTTATFPITTSAVTAPARVVITAAGAEGYRPRIFSLLPEGLLVQPNHLLGGRSATGTVVLPQPAPAGGTIVALETDDLAAQVPATVTVPAGESVATFPISTAAVGRTTAVHIAASANGVRWPATLTLLAPPVFTVAVDPSPVSGGLAATGTATLTSPAPQGGATITLASDHPEVATVPATVTVPAGATQVSFPVRTAPVERETSVQISASSGGPARTATLKVIPVRLVSISASPDQVAGPGYPPPQSTVTLSGPAPEGGANIQLSSDQPDLVSFWGGGYYVPAGLTSSSLPITVRGVASPTDVVITARYAGATASTTLHLLPPSVVRVQLMPDEVVGGGTVEGSVSLNGDAPRGGAVVRLSSDHPEIVSVPAQLTINSAPPLAFFTVTTQRPAKNTLVRITAAAGGQSQSAALTVYGVFLSKVTITPSVVLGGSPATGKVTLSGPAPGGGALVRLFNDHGGGASAPDSVLVPAGKTEATFPIQTQPVPFSTNFSVEADYGGAGYRAGLQIVPLAVAAMSLQPTDVTGGETVTATITLNFPAGPGGAAVALVNDRPQTAHLPAAVTVPPGAAQVSFPVPTVPVAVDTQVRLSATLGGETQRTVMDVRAPRLAALTLEPAALPGGGFTVGRITLTGITAIAGAEVALASSDPIVTSLPDHASVPPGEKEVVFAVTTSSVPAARDVAIRATLAGTTRAASLTLLPSPAPPATFSVSVIPSQVKGGEPSRGAIALAGPAPAGGLVLKLSTDHASLVTVPAQVVAQAGASAVTFPIETRPVTAPASISISAKSGGEIETAILKLVVPNS
jgi:hypothetical protein